MTLHRWVVRILDDVDVADLPATAVVDLMRQALVDHHHGRLLAPPRVRGGLAGNDVVFTVGGRRDGVQGFRAYRDGEAGGEQVVVVWGDDGDLVAVVRGQELGARRTGALGAVSVDALARRDAHRLAIIGTGQQAWTQVWAAAAVRPLTAVSVFSRGPSARAAFAHRIESDLRIPAEPVADPRSALDGADVVVLATTSTTPVINADDVPAGAHVVTVGPKSVAHHETPVDLLARVSVVSCDSLDQAAAYDDPFFVPLGRLTGLGGILAGAAEGRRHDADITLHCSVGLAGTEVIYARAVAEARARHG